MNSIRPNVLKMTPYSPGKPISEVKRELGLSEVVKLASNENPLGPSPKAVAAVAQAAQTMNSYPDGAAYEVKQAISKKFGIAMEHLLVGNGSDEIIHMLGLVFLGSPEDEIIVGDPSFVRYDAAAYLAPSVLTKVPLTSDLRHDLPAMGRAASANTKLVFIANPNNPTGTMVTKAEVDALLRDLPPSAVVVMDEAYYEFACDQPDYPDSRDYVLEGRPVIGLRTFSKAYGLAGIRMGFGFAPLWVVDAVDRAREPFNVNSLAQAATIAALDDDEHVRRTVETNRRGVVRVADALAKAGFQPCETFANFVFAELGRPAAPLFQALLKRGVIVRSGDAFGCPTALRVSVGTDAEVDAFVNALEAVMAEGAVR